MGTATVLVAAEATALVARCLRKIVDFVKLVISSLGNLGGHIKELRKVFTGIRNTAPKIDDVQPTIRVPTDAPKGDVTVTFDEPPLKTTALGLDVDRPGIKVSAAQLTEQQALDHLIKVNPDYDSGQMVFGRNCMSCAQAYLLRLRGMDVEALPATTGAPNWLDATEQVQSFWGRKFATMAPADIRSSLEKAGPGAHGIVLAFWKNNPDSHFLVAHNIGGEVRFLDPQNRLVDVDTYFEHTEFARFIRTDDLTYRSDPKEFVREIED